MSEEELITYDWARIIGQRLQKLGIADDSIAIEIRPTGSASRGLPCYSGFIKILRWMPQVTPVLLINLPLIDDRIRKEIQTFSAGKHVRFSGLWVHASARMRDAPQFVLHPQL